MKKYLLKSMKYFGHIAIYTAVLSANTTCTWFTHQPKVPQGLNKLKNQ